MSAANVAPAVFWLLWLMSERISLFQRLHLFAVGLGAPSSLRPYERAYHAYWLIRPYTNRKNNDKELKIKTAISTESPVLECWSMKAVLIEEESLRWKGFVKQVGFQSGVWGNEGRWEWWIDGTKRKHFLCTHRKWQIWLEQFERWGRRPSLVYVQVLCISAHMLDDFEKEIIFARLRSSSFAQYWLHHW